MGSTARVRVDHLVTSGTFSLDGGCWDVDNKVWLIGDDAECVLIDAPHDAVAILAAIGDRRLITILCTHAHDDHVDAVLEVEAATGAPIWLHADDRELWARTHPDRMPDGELDDGQEFSVGVENPVVLRVVHTPGHSWGSVCFVADSFGAVFTGDTLFNGGPGATGRTYSDFPTIVESIRTRLLTLPAETVVHTGHGEDTTIGAEAPHLQEWIERGH